MPTSFKDHWNKRYTDTPVPQLGWYEPRSTPSVQLIENCAVTRQSTILDVGSGASTLIANLLDLGYQNLIAVDISEVAIEKAKALLTDEQVAHVRWVIDDITHPSAIVQLQNIAVWHDRAVLHFLTEEQDRQTYHSVMQKIVMPGGFVIIAAFALNGAQFCSGLPVHRYSVDSLCEFLGDRLKLVESFSYMYSMPSGDVRPYVYARFQKN